MVVPEDLSVTRTELTVAPDSPQMRAVSQSGVRRSKRARHGVERNKTDETDSIQTSLMSVNPIPSPAPLGGFPDFATLLQEMVSGNAEPEQETPIDTRVLDSTLALIAEYGERRLTMDDVAAGSQVARATIFRRFGSKDALLGRVYQREIRLAGQLVREAVQDVANAPEAIAAGYSVLVIFVCEHPVIQRLARAEPDIMVELWRRGEPSGHSVMRALLSSLALSRPDGATIDPRKLDELSDVLVRLMLAYVVAPDELSAHVLADDHRTGFVARLVTGLLA